MSTNALLVAGVAAFVLGALIPLVAILTSPRPIAVPVTMVSVVVALIVTGSVAAHLGGAPRTRAALRTVAGGLWGVPEETSYPGASQQRLGQVGPGPGVARGRMAALGGDGEAHQVHDRAHLGQFPVLLPEQALAGGQQDRVRAGALTTAWSLKVWRRFPR